ncbi:tail fiber assembly protein [Escherichia coli]|uniref:tail fiber assembly protein n=1 Tax=Escherichia coli TaxID=562 RepID=UPI001FCE4EE7|nr:tail fiber assembly protein [Escherichia coli]
MHKQFLLDEATQRITIWQTKLLMGRKLTDDESASLNAWMDYIDEVAKTKAVTAPDIVWPTPPGEQAN